MNAVMRIQVIAYGRQAQQQLRGLNTQVNTLNASMMRANAAGAGMGRMFQTRYMEKWGKNLQWTGRQIEYNFTLPIVLAGAAAMKFALDNEKAMTRLIKVYGDGSEEMAKMAKEDIPLLRRGFEALSSMYGVQQKEVIEVGAAWAQAGRQGVALARATKLTLETAILGNFELAEAQKALIVIQDQYRLNTQELTEALAVLNMIENRTAVNLGGLIEAIQRAGGIAVSAGVDIRHLGAMIAALVPATGSATQAGNALRTMMSRIMAPTSAAYDMFRELGLAVDSASWHNANFTERLGMLTEGMDGLTKSQRNVVATTVASRWQVARFDTLIRSIVDPVGRYADALNSTADSQRNMLQFQNEINAVLQSSPQRFKILMVQVQNLMARVIQPLIPALMAVVSQVVKLMQKFAALPIETQTVVLSLLALLAVFGPISRVIGSTALLLSRLLGLFKVLVVPITIAGKALAALVPILMGVHKWVFIAFKALGAAIAAVVVGFKALFGGGILKTAAAFAKMLGAILLGPFGVILAGLAVFFGLFNGQIRDGLIWVRENFNRLPEIIANAFRSVLRVLRSAGDSIRRMLRNMFSFATPSIGINAQPAGSPAQATPMATGGRVFGSGRGDTVPAMLEPGEFVMRRSAVNQYGVKQMEEMNAQKFRTGGLVQRFANGGSVLDRFNVATASARARMEAARRAEQRSDVVAVAPNAGPAFDAMVRQIGVLTRQLNAMEPALRAQQQQTDLWGERLRIANRELDVQQKRLNELTKVADRYRNALDEAQGIIDTLARTPITGMRKMSDQIFANEMAQKRLRLEMLKMEEAGEGIDDLRARMARLAGDLERLRASREDLRLAGAGSDVLGQIDKEIANMERAYRAMGDSSDVAKYDEMAKEMEKLRREAERLDLEESLQFDPLRRQIEQLTDTMDEMPFDKIVAGIKEQQREVAKLTPLWEQADRAVQNQQAVVDALTDRRDAVQEVYDTERHRLEILQGEYSRVESQLRDMESALDDFASKAKQAREEAEKAAKEDKLPPHIERFRDAAIGEEGWEDVTGSFSPIEDDIGLEELVRQWEEEANQLFGDMDLFKPLRENIEKKWTQFQKWFKERLAKLGFEDFSWDGLFAGVQVAWNNSWLGNLWGHISPAMKVVWDQFVQFFKDLVDTIIEELGNWTGGFAQMGREFETALNFLLKIWENVWNALSHLLQPILDGIVELVRNVLQLIRGIWDVFAGIFSGDWDRFWSGIATIVDAIWDTLYNLVKTGLGLIWGFIKGVLDGLDNFFKEPFERLVAWWDEFWANFGQTIVDAWTGINDWLEGHFATLVAWWDNLWADIFQGVADALTGLGKWVNSFFSSFASGWNKFWSGVRDFIAGIWNAITKKVSDVWNGLRFLVNAGAQYLRDRILHWLTVARDNARDRWDSMWAKVSAIWTAIKTLVNAGAQYLRDRILHWLTTARDNARDRWDQMWTKVSGVWTGIKTLVNAAAQYVRDRIAHWFTAARDTATNLFNSIRDRIVGPMNTAKSKVEEVASAMRRAFENARDGIGRAVDGIRSKLATPINWVIDTAYNNGIRKFWNAIASKINMGQLGAINRIKLNKGGKVPGAGNRDTVPAMLTPGEFVIRKNAARVLGRDALERLNRADRDLVYRGQPVTHSDGGCVQHFAQGGWVTGKTYNMHSEFMNRLGKWAKEELKRPYNINSGYRSLEEQRILHDRWQRRVPGQAPAAPPGRSNHNFGLASDGARLGSRNPGKYGLVYPMSYEPWHIEPIGAAGMRGGGAGTWQEQPDAGIVAAFREVWNFVRGLTDSTDEAVTMARRATTSVGKGAIGYGLDKIPLGSTIKRMIGFYNGGIVKGSRHGQVIRVGENYRDEQIVPLSRDWSGGGESGGGTTNHFHGQLVFPNVKDGDDAEAFIRNLEAMVN